MRPHIKRLNKELNLATFKPRTKMSGINDIIDNMADTNGQLINKDGDKSMIGTAIPYLYSIYSDLIINPSTVSITEFQKMAYSQPVIATALSILCNLVKNEIGNIQHDNPKYQEYLTKTFDNMDRPFNELVADMFTAVWAGFYVGEKKLESDGRYIYVKDVKPRPATSIVFRVHSDGELKDDGIIQYYFNNLWVGNANWLAFNQINANGSQRPNPYAAMGDAPFPVRTAWVQPIGAVVIPREKCVHWKYKGLDGLDSPYGRSLLRSAYDSYLVRSELTKITRNAAKFKSSPIPVAVVDPNQANTEKGITAYEELGDALSNLGEGTTNPFLLTVGKLNETISFTNLNTTADLDKLVMLNKYFDSMMLLSCLFQADVMGLSDKGSYALGETQSDLIGRNVTALAESIQDCLIDQIAKPMLQINFDEQEDFGYFAKAEHVSEDVVVNLQKLEALRNVGIKLKQNVYMEMMGLREDDIESVNNPVGDFAIDPKFTRGSA